MAISKIQAESMNLADTYAFTGTVSGTPQGLVRLGGANATGQNVGDVSFDLFTSDYDMYYVTFVLSHTSNGETWLRLRSSSSYLTSDDYRQAMTGRRSDGTAANINYSGSNKFQLTGTSESNNSHNQSCGALWFFKPQVSGKTTQVLSHIFDFTSTILACHRTGAHMFMSSGAHTGFGLLGTSNIDEYNIQVFGVKQS